MDRPKSILEDPQQDKSYITQNQYIKYVPVDMGPEFMYYNPVLVHPNERINNRLKSELHPAFKTYYIPVPSKQEVAKEMFYKHTRLSDPYMQNKPYSVFAHRDSSQKNFLSDYRSTYLRYPKYIRDESGPNYVDYISRESGNYTGRQDYYYEYKNNKFSLDDSLVHGSGLYYDNFISKDYPKKRSSRTIKHSDFHLGNMRQSIPLSEKSSKQCYEEKRKNTKIAFEALSQKIEAKLENKFSFFPEKQEFGGWNKEQLKKYHEEFPEIKTIYNRNKKISSVHCSTTASPPKNHCNKSTQTLGFDFTEKRKNVCSIGTQTENSDDQFVSKKNDGTPTFHKFSTDFTESVIRWTKQIFLYFLWTVYSCPNPEQVALFVQKPKKLKTSKQTKPSPSSSQLPLEKRMTRSNRLPRNSRKRKN